MYRLCNLRTSAPSTFPRFWLDEQWQRCVSLAHKEFRKRKKQKCSDKYLILIRCPIRIRIFNISQYHHYLAFGHFRYFMSSEPRGHGWPPYWSVWPRLRVGSPTETKPICYLRNDKRFQKCFPLGTVLLTGSFIKGYFAVSSQCYLQKLLF